MDPPSRLHPNKAFPLCSSQCVSSCRATTSSARPHRLGLFSLTLFLTQLKEQQRFSVRFQKYVKLIQRLFKGKDIFNMDSTEGTLMITWIGLSRLSLRLGSVPNSNGVPNPKDLYGLCSPIYSMELIVKVSRRATASLDYPFWDPYP